MQKKTILINDKIWKVVVFGKGKKTVVVLPNILLFPQEWSFYAKKLGLQYRIVIPVYPQIASYNEMVSGLNQLLRKLKVTNFILVGNSIGGMLAQGYAKRYPKDVKEVILIATIAPHKLYGFFANILCVIGYVSPAVLVQAFAYWHAKISLVSSKENTVFLPKLKKHVFADLSKDHFLALGRCIVDFCKTDSKVPQSLSLTTVDSTGDVVFSFFKNLTTTYPKATSYTLKGGLHLVELNKKKDLLAIVRKNL